MTQVDESTRTVSFPAGIVGQELKQVARQIPADEPLRNHKISYAYYMGRRLDPPQSPLMSDRQVDTEPKRAGK